MQLVTALLALPIAAVAFAPTARPLRSHNAATIVRSSPATGAGEATRKPRPKYVPGRIDDPDYVRGQYRDRDRYHHRRPATTVITTTTNTTTAAAATATITTTAAATTTTTTPSVFDTTLRDGEQSPGATLVCEPLPAPFSCQPLTS